MIYRLATFDDVAVMAEIRAGDWGTAQYWESRLRQYMMGDSTPRMARADRAVYVAADGERIAGLIAGHLTRRFQCGGELQWISVRPEYRGCGVSGELLKLLAQWFAAQNAVRVCVDVSPTNEVARRFYRRNGAVDLKPGWMAWDDIRFLANRAMNEES